MARHCDFCEKSEHQVRKLIANAKENSMVFICDECVFLCLELIEDTDKAITANQAGKDE